MTERDIKPIGLYVALVLNKLRTQIELKEEQLRQEIEQTEPNAVDDRQRHNEPRKDRAKVHECLLQGAA